MLKLFFDYLYWFQIFIDQGGSVPSIPVAKYQIGYNLQVKTTGMK